jgi:hypothetical protein
MTSAILLVLLLPAGEPGPEPFSMIGRYDVTCPVCKQVFTALACPVSNLRGGVDRDLFARALGPQPEFYRVTTCPRCGYSGYHGDFDPDVVLPPGFKERVLQSPKLHLPEGFGPESDPRDLDASDRYALAVTCYQWRGKSDEALGWLYLRASWIARQEGSGLPEDARLARMFEYLERWRPVLGKGDNQADGELRTAARLAEAIAAGEFNRYQRPYAELALAVVLRRHGENRPAGVLLERLADYERFSELLRAGVKRMLDSTPREREAQARAADCFERALMAEQIAPPNRGPACYLLGELYRRLGRERESIRWYDQAVAEPNLPPSLREWAVQQRAVAAEQGGGPADRGREK